ncbi:6049_t:CDS:1, partial [Funneliformis caledonium]
YLNAPITPILSKNTSTMKVDSVEKSSTNKLNKEKGPETFTSKITIQKITMSVNESFDVSKNLLDTSTLNFEASSTQIVKFFTYILMKKFLRLNSQMKISKITDLYYNKYNSFINATREKHPIDQN